MKSSQLFALSICCTLLIACSPLWPLRPADNTLIEQWLEQHRYRKAILALEQRVQSHPSKDDQARLQKARALAGAYDRNRADEALRRRAKGDWKGAAAVLDEALSNYPDGKQLLSTRKLLRREQTQTLKQLKTQLLSAKAKWLLQSTPLYREMARTEPDNLSTAWKAEQAELETRKTADRLYVLGVKALSRRDLGPASRYLNLADRMYPSEPTTRALAQLAQLQKRQRQQQRKRQQRTINQQRLQKSQQLMEQIHRAMVNADLPTAKETLAKLSAIDKDNPKLVQLKQALDNAINAKVTELTEQGNLLYSKGKIQQAKESWVSALELDPDNQRLLSRIERADRVLDKLHELKVRNGSNSQK